MRTQRVLLSGPKAVGVEEVELGPPGPGEVIMQVLHAGICGSDLHTYHSGHPWLDYPIRPGHEISGVVVAAGAGGTAVEGDLYYVNPVISCGRCSYSAVGQTNLCDRLVGVGSHIPGGMAERVKLPESSLRPVPTDISPLAASLIEPAATAARAMRASPSLAGRSVAVLGASTIGLLVTGMAVEQDPAELVATDLVEAKRLRALEWGAGATTGSVGPDALRAALGDRPQVVFDCVGSPLTVAAALGTIAKAGAVVVVGAEHGEAHVELSVIQDGEVTLTGVAMYTTADLVAAEGFVTRRSRLVESLVTDRFSVAEAPRAFERAGSGQALKVQLTGAGTESGCASDQPGQEGLQKRVDHGH